MIGPAGGPDRITAFIASGGHERTREFVAGLPATGAVIFVQDRYAQNFVRDLVIATHGVRGNEATSVFIAERAEDEAQHLIENRRPVFRHPDLIALRERLVNAAAPPSDERRVPRGAPIDTSLTAVNAQAPSEPTASPERPKPSASPFSLDRLRDWAPPPGRQSEPEPEGDLIIATINIVRDRRSGRPYLLQAPSVRRGTFMETHDTLDSAIAALPAVARRVIGSSRA